MNQVYRTTIGLLVSGLTIAMPLSGSAQQKKPAPKKTTSADARDAIRESDLKRDLFALAGDHYRGREGGTLDELRASAWIAEQMRAIGAQPAGDDGTYFQFFHIQRTRITKGSRLSIGNHQLKVNEDAIITVPGISSVNAPMVFVGTGTPEEVAKVDIKGKAVALVFSGTPPASTIFRYFLNTTMRTRSAELVKAGAVAVVYVSDARAQEIFNRWGTIYERGRYDLPGGPNTKVAEQAPTIWLPESALSWVQQAGQQLVASINVESFSYPSVNIVAKVPGTDAKLKAENVLFSTHQDHDGVRRAVAGDSIWNGADDNATGCAGTLAVMRAFVKKPGRRTALFVFHGAEERGLLGSRYYSATPTVPKESIVAVLNAEMIGRNAPDSAALLGSQRPHRNSQDLVNLAMTANQTGPKFKLDTLWDKATHPEGWYFRSDHLPYARLGIPAICYTTLLHKDYHTPKDEPDRINIAKMANVTRWIYLTGWAVANRDQRPTPDKDFKLER
ncbi:M28 family peptidase [Hymenobacter sp. BT491]|uniref:M28 family peptidase n=1 Tax=Hymenobacter sp. BT491 TaxID=2766779 RepID=UPI0016534204|nr:M28 family peptidase [Hymenobacter sp. BT491]